MKDEQLSPDLFDDSQVIPQDIEDTVNWKGASMYDILRDGNPWNHYTPPLSPSRHHSVLFQLPVTLSKPPKPFYSSKGCQWDNDNVRLPFHPNNLFPVQEGDEKVIKPRWEIIQCALLRPILNSHDLERAILSYNKRQRKFSTLHYFFENILVDEETEQFFSTELPKIIQLALQLPELIQASLPILKMGKSHSISLSQLQIASILANAFLCTFPTKENMSYCPGINFFSIYEVQERPLNRMYEKLKCILHYFRRVCNRVPVGVVTFTRKYMPESQLPRWDKLNKNIAHTKLHVTSTGTIEDDGLGLLQVDFANCMIGGGALQYGCVQEEIRFMVCPELITSMLFTERMGVTEAVYIIGAETYSRYKGYADNFEWAGNFQDETPFDLNGRRRTTIVAIDATHFSNQTAQFRPTRMIRELHKAFVGFHEDPSVSRTILAPVATGNWGCGAFNGNVHLKALLQIMACTATERDIVYFTFGDAKLRDEIYHIHQFLVSNNVTINQLWHYLCLFNISHLNPRKLLSFVQQTHSSSETRSGCGGKLSCWLKNSGKEGSDEKYKPSSSKETEEEECDSKNPNEEAIESDSSSQPSACPEEQTKPKDDCETSKVSHEDIVSFLWTDEKIDAARPSGMQMEQMETDDSEPAKSETNDAKKEERSKCKATPKKITDYFGKM